MYDGTLAHGLNYMLGDLYRNLILSKRMHVSMEPCWGEKGCGDGKARDRQGDYERLAEFRYLLRLLRRFLIFSQKAAVELS
jgi:hypothetical protein